MNGCQGIVANSFQGSATKAEKVYGPNAPRLRELKQKYDPTRVFKKILDLSPDVNGHSVELPGPLSQQKN